MWKRKLSPAGLFAIVVLVGLVVTVALPTPGPDRALLALSRGKQVATALLLYEADNEQLPKKETWGEATKRYLREEHCHEFIPGEPANWIRAERKPTYFAFNSDLQESSAKEDVLIFGSFFQHPYRWGSPELAARFPGKEEYLYISKSGRAMYAPVASGKSPFLVLRHEARDLGMEITGPSNTALVVESIL